MKQVNRNIRSEIWDASWRATHAHVTSWAFSRISDQIRLIVGPSIMGVRSAILASTPWFWTWQRHSEID